jgi:hypothetical protein
MNSIKKYLIAIAIVLLSVAKPVSAQETSTPALVWCGIDYSKCKFIGTQDFRQPDQIFPGMLEAWNGLFMKEMLPELEKMAKSVGSDLNAVEANNAKAGESQIIHQDGTKDEMVTPTDITDADIAKIVGAYDLKHNKGVGLVFIMDRLVKAQETGCLYVVFFDLNSRKVLHAERVVSRAAGMGFRNYWFRPVKDAVKKLPGIYKQLPAA